MLQDGNFIILVSTPYLSFDPFSFPCIYNEIYLLHCVLGRNPSPMWDKLVFNKIKARLGGRVRLMTSGASPLSADVMEFLRM